LSLDKLKLDDTPDNITEGLFPISNLKQSVSIQAPGPGPHSAVVGSWMYVVYGTPHTTPHTYHYMQSAYPWPHTVIPQVPQVVQKDPTWGRANNTQDKQVLAIWLINNARAYSLVTR
jgi:hypothetical protein